MTGCLRLLCLSSIGMTYRGVTDIVFKAEFVYVLSLLYSHKRTKDEISKKTPTQTKTTKKKKKQ